MLNKGPGHKEPPEGCPLTALDSYPSAHLADMDTPGRPGAPAVSGGGSRDPQQEGQTAGGPPVSERQSSGPWPLPNLGVQFYKKMKGKYS